MTSYDIELAVKVLVAALLGAIIGFERQRFRKPAGVRTQILICVGSALLAGISVDIAEMYTIPGTTVRPDPARLMAQIVTGIGFLGGGVILKDKTRISGVTTAATIWITAAVGIAVGAGFYMVAALCAFLVLFLHPLAHIKHKAITQKVSFVLRTPKQAWSSTVKLLEASEITYNIVSVDTSRSKFKVFSTQLQKKEIANQLHAKAIDFEIEDIR